MDSRKPVHTNAAKRLLEVNLRLQENHALLIRVVNHGAKTARREMIPGLGDALARQELIRNAAFLSVTETVGGFEILPMNLIHYTTLTMMGSPLVTGGTPSPLDVMRFLWVLSPDYSPAGGKPLKIFRDRCRLFSPPRKPWIKNRFTIARWKREAEFSARLAARAVKEARSYLADTLMDFPRSRGGNASPSYFSEACSMCGLIARSYGWSEKEILTMPLKRVSQYRNEIKLSIDPKAVLFNPSDGIIAEHLVKLNAAAKAPKP